MKTILVEGWRFIPHSYATVNQMQCLELLKRPDLKLFHRDLPLPNPAWSRTEESLLGADFDMRLRAIPEGDSGLNPDLVYRIAFPYDLRKSGSSRTFVFATSEYTRLNPSMFAEDMSFQDLTALEKVELITPSKWSKNAFVETGFTSDRIHVVPHGFDPAVLHPPADEERLQLRKLMGLENSFVFLHIGAMSANKGIELILKAFAHIAALNPEARLVFKGTDSLYNSSSMLFGTLKDSLSSAELALVEPRISYTGKNMNAVSMAALYKAADVYVSPYKAEGFNMPVLESMACGLPVICSRGGSTDDFTRDDFVQFLICLERNGWNHLLIILSRYPKKRSATENGLMKPADFPQPMQDVRLHGLRSRINYLLSGA